MRYFLLNIGIEFGELDAFKLWLLREPLEDGRDGLSLMCISMTRSSSRDEVQQRRM